RERTIRGRRAKVEAGKLVGGSSDLYGYRRDKAIPGRVVYEPEAEVVRRIFRWAGEEGQSIRSVVRRPNDSRTAAPSEGKRNLGRTAYWGKGCLRRILTNEAYMGETYAYKWKNNGPHRIANLLPKENWLRLPDGLTPAIVSADLWDMVQHRLATNKGEA